MGIDNHLKVIKEGVFGRDVRQAIHDGIQQAYDDATANGNANMEVAKARGSANTLGNRLDDITTRISSIAEGSPKGTYANLADLQTAKPDGDNGIYVTTDNGHWYYYNSGWKDGGVYQSMTNNMDFKDLSNDLLNKFNFDATFINFEIVTGSFFSYPVSKVLSDTNVYCSNLINVVAGEVYAVKGYSYYDGRVLTFVNKDGKAIEGYPNYSDNGVEIKQIVKVPKDATGMYLNSKVGKSLILFRVNDIYGKLGNLANIAQTSIKSWENVPLTIDKLNTYYSVYNIYPANTGAASVTYKPIAVRAGETYQVEGSSYWDGRLWILVNKNGDVSRSFSKNDQYYHSDQITIQDDEVCLLINSGKAAGDSKLLRGQIGSSKNGFTVIGDSWTDPVTLGSNPNWVDFCKQLFSSKYSTNLDVINLGSGGTGFVASNGKLGNYANRTIQTIYNTYVIFGSFNDAFVNFEFGDAKTHQAGTLHGAMHDVTTKIYAANPDAKILFVTPVAWGSIHPRQTDKFGVHQNAAEFAEKYVSAMIEFANYNTIPVLDLYHGSNMRPWDEAFIDKFYHGTSETDTTHANTDGHRRLSPQIADFIFKEV